jgi:hypothetical protein
MLARRDFSELDAIVHPDAVFRSPMAFKPYGPAPALLLALRTVLTILENLEYHRRFADDDGTSVVLEFSATLGDKRLKGIDMIRFDVDGSIVEFEVMVRPFNALQALGIEMGARLGSSCRDSRSAGDGRASAEAALACVVRGAMRVSDP